MIEAREIGTGVASRMIAKHLNWYPPLSIPNSPVVFGGLHRFVRNAVCSRANATSIRMSGRGQVGFLTYEPTPYLNQAVRDSYWLG